MRVPDDSTGRLMNAIDVLRLSATLSPPPGINATYRTARGGHWYMTPRASAWEQEALLLLRLAGFREQPAGSYWVAVQLGLFTIALDCDAPIKLVLDTIERALAIDDRWIGELRVTKHIVHHRPEQRLEVACQVWPVADRGEFTALSERVAALCE